jgi:S1-C subfamily serine protease
MGIAIVAMAWAGTGVRAQPGTNALDSVRSVFKIHVSMQRPDYAQPWQAGGSGSGTGTGFLIGKKRLLTNAHVVADATFIEVQPHGDARKIPARVVYIGYDCDLAVLELEDESILEGLSPLELGDRLPELGDEVYAIGYPVGGTMLSLTRGVVSRLDSAVYALSGADQHLVMQIDAAINPGNSGGPVVSGDRVVGVVFQGISQGQGLGYCIPLPVVRHFLEDIEDGRYHGYPELGVNTLDSRNPALREALGIPDPNCGVLVTYVDGFSAAAKRLRAGDVLLSADGFPVAPDATVQMDGRALNFTELVERKQWGQPIVFDVWREGKSERIEVPLDNPPDPFAYRNEYDVLPEYVLTGGLCFMPISRGLIGTLGNKDPRAVQSVLYYAQRGKSDGLVGDRRQFVVLAGVLPHPFNTYTASFLYRIVKEINGRPIRALADVPAALAEPAGGFHVIRFDGHPLPLILDATGLPAVNLDIQLRYNVPALQRIREETRT